MRTLRDFGEMCFMVLVLVFLFLVILPNVMAMSGMDGFPTLADAMTVLR